MSHAPRSVVWLPGLAVATGAAVATAHGLFEVAVAAHVPAGIAWLYPLITDGLALVAYAATARLTGGAGRYAWAVVVLSTGLSGLAQASYLASGATLDAPAALRFGVGAWPALAAAVVAHLLYLLAERPLPAEPQAIATPAPQPEAQQPEFAGPVPIVVPAEAPGVASVQAGESSPVTEREDYTASAPSAPDRSVAVPTGVQPVLYTPEPVQPALYHAVAAELVARAAAPHGQPASRIASDPDVRLDPPVEHPASVADEPAPRERARAAAERHAEHHGALPTVSELEALAAVSRGTAGAVLKSLRQCPSRSTSSPTPPNRRLSHDPHQHQ